MKEERTHIGDHQIAAALEVAAERRRELAAIKAEGRPGAGAEALCNGALRHAIRASDERSKQSPSGHPRPLSRRQMDRIIEALTRRRFSTEAGSRP